MLKMSAVLSARSTSIPSAATRNQPLIDTRLNRVAGSFPAASCSGHQHESTCQSSHHDHSLLGTVPSSNVRSPRTHNGNTQYVSPFIKPTAPQIPTVARHPRFARRRPIEHPSAGSACLGLFTYPLSPIPPRHDAKRKRKPRSAVCMYVRLPTLLTATKPPARPLRISLSRHPSARLTVSSRQNCDKQLA